MQHVGVRKDDVGVFSYVLPVFTRSIAVESSNLETEM